MIQFGNEDRKKIVDYLKDKWKGKSCPLCQSGHWMVQDSCFQLMTYNPDAFLVGGPVLPLIPVTCSNCSNTILINALLSGMINPKPKVSPDQEKNTSIGVDKD